MDFWSRINSSWKIGPRDPNSVENWSLGPKFHIKLVLGPKFHGKLVLGSKFHGKLVPGSKFLVGIQTAEQQTIATDLMLAMSSADYIVYCCMTIADSL